MKSKLNILKYRRKREGKTNYKKRLGLLKSGKPRLVVRPSLKNITIQIVKYEPKGDKVIVGVSSKSLAKMGWKASLSNTPAAYLTGMLLAKKAADKKVENLIFDIGLIQSVKGSKVFAALKGAVDGGLKIPLSKEVMPDETRINGSHISEYAKKLKQESKEKYERHFSAYIKAGFNPEDLPKAFEDTKKKIEGS
jgi:large subunit ribosomal protein L18